MEATTVCCSSYEDETESLRRLTGNQAAAIEKLTSDRKILESAVVKLEARVRELTARAAAFEDEVNQGHCANTLLWNECIRLRNAHLVLVSFIESLPEMYELPTAVTTAADAVFPERA